ncbi:zinc-dependent alcohol dehydrogenase family protein [Meiothermus rufus]|uniref:zinc-dependent alcohol dehydrogenase family protein n=1 Tax=Meiothermus rufus TaxID=604332 RepID=UPI00040A0B19|nr:zinc-dependent alcohol dehydrogenase family protein [Meiothermus rufus]
MRMQAILLEAGQPLYLAQRPVPSPGPGQLLLRVQACGVCRTDLHILDGELPPPSRPLVLGHQVVGEVVALGEGVEGWRLGQWAGVPWLGWACGVCRYCRRGQENLCERALFTGYHLDGGFAEYTLAYADFAYPLPEGYAPVELAPLLCAGLIGYRSLRLAGAAQRLGLYGFGAAAHLLVQVAVYQGREVYAFTRPGDTRAQQLARALGAVWAGGSDQAPPQKLDAAILFAPVGPLVPKALQDVDKGGVVVCGGIHMSDIPSFPYALLWEERVLRSVANLTRQDGLEFLRLAGEVRLRPVVQVYPLEAAPQALEDLRAGRVEGAAVLQVC